MGKMTGLSLRCKSDHYGWGAWELAQVDSGFVLVVPCDLGPHYLAPQPDGTLGSQQERYEWPTRGAAEDALTRWEQQEAGKE